jgi:hypothetical protein
MDLTHFWILQVLARPAPPVPPVKARKKSRKSLSATCGSLLAKLH